MMTGPNYAMGANVRRVPGTQNFEVFCNWCNRSINTMSYNTLRDAIWATLGRGGVLCPGCRKLACDGCGTLSTSMARYEARNGGREQNRLCLACAEFAYGEDVSKRIGVDLKVSGSQG